MGGDLPESIGDLQGCVEVGLFPVGEAKEKPYPMHVSVQRDDQLGWGDQVPSPGINVVPSHHPAQEKVEPFAGTALARSWNQEITPSGKKRLCKSLKRRNDRIIITAKVRHKALLKGTMFFYHRLHAPEQAGKILPGVNRCLKSERREGGSHVVR